jgi:hypothetical protein
VPLPRKLANVFILYLTFRGVTKKLQRVVDSVEEMMDDGAEFLRPVDPMPLSDEETQAVVLMRSFCPQQSTPDPLVGTCIAQGFAHCLPTTAPPVLTKSGVVQGDKARLPYLGMESFVSEGVVRQVVYKNAEEYHTVIAACRNLALDDVLQSLHSDTFEEEKAVFFINWWTKYARTDTRAVLNYGTSLKEALKFYAFNISSVKKERPILLLKTFLFRIDERSLLAKFDLPVPDIVLPKALQLKLGKAIFNDQSMKQWFSPLPVEVWADFISHHDCITMGKDVDARMRLDVLTVLAKEFESRALAERVVFGNFIASLLANKPCIPYESTGDVKHGVDRPGDLYAYSAELEAFTGIGDFRKVSCKLKDAGVTEEFLLALGVRKSVSVEFLFASLDTLKWSNDPKPLIEYLRAATLTQKDLSKLSGTKYLPAAGDSSRTYAPSELYLPSLDLRKFSFVKMLQWPSESEVSLTSTSGKFLVKLGMKVIPPLSNMLKYISEVTNEKERLNCLDFLADNLGVDGAYHKEYSAMAPALKQQYRILPCVIRNPLQPATCTKVIQTPLSAFYLETCGVMGFAILDPKLAGDRSKLYGSLFQCPPEPSATDLLQQLLQLLATSQSEQRLTRGDSLKEAALSHQIESMFEAVFMYLSHRSSDFGQASIQSLKSKAFIPCRKGDSIKWYQPDQVFFRRNEGEPDKITEGLFHVIEFSPFLATIGGTLEYSISQGVYGSN